jgi:hypothetical protein
MSFGSSRRFSHHDDPAAVLSPGRRKSSIGTMISGLSALAPYVDLICQRYPRAHASCDFGMDGNLVVGNKMGQLDACPYDVSYVFCAECVFQVLEYICDHLCEDVYESKDMQHTSVHARMLTFADKPIPIHQPYYIYTMAHTKEKTLIHR